MSGPAPSRRLYVGRIQPDTQRQDLEDHFSNNGQQKLTDVRIMGNYAFVEYEDLRDAEDAVRDLHDRDFMGQPVPVTFARPARTFEQRGPPPMRGPARGGSGKYRVIVTGFGQGTSWQDLKDWARGAAPPLYTDVSRDRPDEGIVEFGSSRDLDEAFRRLDGTELNGSRVRMTEDRDYRPAPPPSYRDDYRRDDRDYRPRDDYRRDDRRDDRYDDRRRDYDDRAPRRDDDRRPPPPRD